MYQYMSDQQNEIVEAISKLSQLLTVWEYEKWDCACEKIDEAINLLNSAKDKGELK